MARIASSRSQKRFRAIWVAQWQFGFVVTPRRCTTRRSISMTNRAQSRPFTASMWKKSVVSMLCALGVKVLRPVRLLPAASRKQPVVAKHVAHGRGRDRDTELAQSAHDAQLTPAGLLLCQSTDQVDVLIGNQRTARSPMRIDPTLPDDPPLPANAVAGVTTMIDRRRWGRSPPARARNARATRVNPRRGVRRCQTWN